MRSRTLVPILAGVALGAFVLPAAVAVVISERPTDPSDAGWSGGVASAVGDDPDAQLFLGANASPC